MKKRKCQPKPITIMNSFRLYSQLNSSLQWNKINFVSKHQLEEIVNLFTCFSLELLYFSCHYKLLGDESFFYLFFYCNFYLLTVKLALLS